MQECKLQILYANWSCSIYVHITFIGIFSVFCRFYMKLYFCSNYGMFHWYNFPEWNSLFIDCRDFFFIFSSNSSNLFRSRWLQNTFIISTSCYSSIASMIWYFSKWCRQHLRPHGQLWHDIFSRRRKIIDVLISLLSLLGWTKTDKIKTLKIFRWMRFQICHFE